jgi:hypothetical protein
MCVKSIYKSKYRPDDPLLIHGEPWESVSMDVMIQLLEWNEMDAILVIVNQFFELAKLVPTRMVATTFDLGSYFLICGLNIMGCLNSL